MNVLNKIISETTFEKDKLSLLQRVSDDFGFFYQNNIVYFAKKNIEESAYHSVSTAYLDLDVNVPIKSDDENNSFKSGSYDMLSYKYDTNSNIFDAFYKICISYAYDETEINFYDFFTTLVELFKKALERDKTNLIGTIGELELIKKIYDDYEIDISKNWHLVGNNSKFDFSFDDFNLEVKTTTSSEMIYKLKHNQVFNNQKNYIGIVSIIEDGTGDSIDDLVNYFASNIPFSNNVKFQIAIQKELLKIDNPVEKNRKFSLDEINFYLCYKLNTIDNIPGCISNVEYDYNFSDAEPIEIQEIFN